MTKKEVEEIVGREIEKYYRDDFDKKMSVVLKKSDSASRKAVLDTIKNALESAFKMFWYKRDFWKSDIK
jgi:hypothetical protein